MLSQADIDMARGLYNHGVSLYNLDKFYEAIVSIDKSLEIFSDFPDSWLVKGLCLSDLAGNLMGVISTEEDLKLMEYKHEADRCFDKALDLVDKIRDIPQAAKLEARILFNKGYNLNSINPSKSIQYIRQSANMGYDEAINFLAENNIQE